MKLYSLLSIAILTLSQLAWAAKAEATTSSSQSNVVLAAQLGPYPVSIYDHEVKTSRPDPLAPTAQLRRLMVTIYRPFLDNFTCPLEYQSQIQYAPPVVAAALLGALLSSPSSTNASSILTPVKLINCTRPVPLSSSSGPLLLFSPGYGGTHHGYASTLQAAASSGYTVVAIDHTYEAAAVVFPDGSVAYPSTATNAYDNSTSGQNFLQAVRIADAVSVLDSIERGDVPGLGGYSNSSQSHNPNSTSASSAPLRALMYGHSFGGSTAVNVAALDPRVIAAANIDGPYYEPITNGTVRKPLLMIQSASLPPVADDWPAFYTAHVRGWKTWVRPNNTVHYGYTDLPLLADLLGLRGAVIPQELTGTVNSRRLQEIVWRYTLQFFAYALRGANPDLLDGPSAEFPDVEFVGHAEAKTGH
jgi:pimeloyl-ACP methyl ester carboxylesterase